MFATLKHVLKDCITENDGKSVDVTRVIVLAVGGSTLPTLIGCTIYSVYASPEHHFNAVDFGTAVCAMLTGLCAAAIGIAQKQKTDTPG